ncbi:MAG: hypothetical protein QOJ59_1222, partial [Thermomicrobiales bacterium]|nr:hypothetical protein [Thermomicrobiales bacterium]
MLRQSSRYHSSTVLPVFVWLRAKSSEHAVNVHPLCLFVNTGLPRISTEFLDSPNLGRAATDDAGFPNEQSLVRASAIRVAARDVQRKRRELRAWRAVAGLCVQRHHEGNCSMTETVADFLVQRLREWGVRRLFGYSGDGINPVLGALRRAGNPPTF